MTRRAFFHHSFSKSFRALSVLALIALILLLHTAAPAAGSLLRAQPLLLSLAAERPDTTISIIVQKTAPDGRVEELVARLGGRVTKDLRIINAFAAELPARAVTQVARSDSVRWVSLDAAMVETDCGTSCIDTSRLQSVYPQAVRADRVWNGSPNFQGQGVGVAVVDSGIAAGHPDLSNGADGTRVVAQAKFNSFTNSMADQYGHGTHVAGIIGGNSTASQGTYIGIAPKANIVSVKVSDDQGAAMTSDVINGLQWVLENKNAYNIRVVNISLNSSVMQSYHVDPLDAAVEILWFNRIVVVVSAGNQGQNALYPPANDPFVITVGAVDDMGTVGTSDDVLAAFSAYGTTTDGFSKPDLLAPGRNLISLLASNGTALAKAHPTHLVSGFSGSQYYFRMSGTSVAAPVVSGAVALILQKEPDLTPDQVKFRLMQTGRSLSGPGNGARVVDVEAAVRSNTTDSANTGTPASQLLWTGSQPVTWDSVNWNSVNWNSVNWNSVNWNSVNWGSVNWGSVNWGSGYWGD